MRQYFEAEMRLLHEAAQSFAKAYPEQAGLLNLHNLRDHDPAIERLLEGFAYLTAQIRRRIDHELPDISAHLIAQFWPQLLRPYPSMTIMQIAAKSVQLQQTHKLPANTLLKTTALGEQHTICQLRTVFPVKIQPLRLVSVQLPTNNMIKLHFDCDAHLAINQLDLSELQLYIQAELHVSLNLYFDLTRQVQNIKLIIPGENNSEHRINSCTIKILPGYLNVQDSLLPNNHKTFSGFSLLLDYFCFREKYFFVVIAGLEKISWPPHTTQFIVELTGQDLLSSDKNISFKNLLLNCVPAVNLYQTTSEPIQIKQDRIEYPLIVDATAQKGIRLFSIDSVTGIETKTGKQHDYQSLYDFKYLQNHARFYAVNFQDQGVELLQPYIQLGGISEAQSEILSCQITVCNGHYPRLYLRENAELQFVNTTTSFIAHNITRPTALITPPQRNHWQWLLISHLSLNYHTLADIKTMQQLLNSYCWNQTTENSRRLAAIQHIELLPLHKMHKGILHQGVLFCLTLDETNYLSIADIYLFGQVLHSFISSYAQFNTYVQLKIICLPSQRELLWDMTPGLNPVI